MKNIVQNRPFFLSFKTEWKNKSYLTQWHTESFQNIKLVSIYSKSVSLKNSKCLHFASVQMKQIVQNRPFFSHSKQSKNESYMTQWHTKGFTNIKLVSLYSKSVSHKNSKCRHFVSVQIKHIVQNRPFFCYSKQNEKVSHIWHDGIPKASRISNWFPFIQSQWAVKIPNVFISHQYRWNTVPSRPYWVFVAPVLMQNDIWNFRGSLTLSKGKPIWYSESLWCPIISKMTHFSFFSSERIKLPVLDYVFHLYWHKMKTFGIFMPHWLWIKGN